MIILHGFHLRPFQVQREGPWKVEFEEFNQTKYPPFCAGGLNFLSRDVLQGVVAICHNHCIGQNSHDIKRNFRQPCFWKFEDTFIGSCIYYTQKKTVRTNVHGRSAFYTEFKRFQSQDSFEKQLNVHGVKTMNEMEEVHKFYQTKRLLN